MTVQAAQQAEVYWMALARDIPFSQFTSNDLIRLAAGKPQSVRREVDIELRSKLIIMVASPIATYRFTPRQATRIDKPSKRGCTHTR